MKPYKRGGIYYIKWTCVPGYSCLDHQELTQHVASLGVRDAVKAREFPKAVKDNLTQGRARHALGLPLEGAAAFITLAEFVSCYKRDRHPSKFPDSQRNDEWVLTALLKYFGDCQLAKLTPDKLQAFRDHMVVGLAT